MSRRPDPRIPEIKRRRADTIAKSERVMTMSRRLTLTRGVLADHLDGVGQYPCGGFLVSGERVHRHDPHTLAERLAAFLEPCGERLLAPAFDHVQQAGRPAFLPGRQVHDDGHRPTANGVCRHTCSSTPISSTPSHWAQHRAAGPSGSQRICHTPPRVPMARCRCTRGRNPNPSRPSNTRPSNVLNSTPSRTVSFTFSFTQRMKPHGPYTPKSEEPGKSTIQGRIK